MVQTQNETGGRNEDIGSVARETVSTVKAEATRRAEGAKRSVVDELGGVASALRRASTEFSDESMEGRAFRQIADGLSGASESLKDKGLGEMVHDLNHFARRHPATFLGAAALLGFAASRFAVASERAHRDDRTDAQQTGPYSTASPGTLGTPPGAPGSASTAERRDTPGPSTGTTSTEYRP